MTLDNPLNYRLVCFTPLEVLIVKLVHFTPLIGILILIC
jgi:hypothetical protein